MIADIIKENENIIGISINTEEYYSQSYNENSFIVTLEDETLLNTIIEILSPTTLKILFVDYVDTNSLNLKTKLFKENGEEINFSNDFVIHEALPEEPTDPTEPTEPIEPTDPTEPTEPEEPEEQEEPDDLNDYSEDELQSHI